MEMIPMMTQPQDITAFVPGMAAAGTAPATPRLSDAPLLFAALLQEMLPPAQTGAEPVVMAVKQALKGKGALPVKGQAGINPETVPAASQSAELKEGRRDNPISTPNVENGAPDFPAPTLDGGSILYPVAAGVAMPYVNGLPPEGGSAAPAQVPEVNGGAGPVDGRLAVVHSVEPDTSDGTLTLHQPWQDAAGSDSPIDMPVITGNMAAPGNTPENNILLRRSRTPDSGGDDSLIPPKLRPTADLQSVRTIAMAPGQAEEPAQSTTATDSSDRSTGRIQSGQSAIGGVQAQVKPAATLASAARNPNVAVPQRETPAEPAVSLARQAPATVDYGTLSGLGPVVLEGWGAALLPVAGGVAANPANLQVEVVFVNPSAKGRASSGNENSESGAKEKEMESTPDPGVTAARTVDTPGSNRFALLPKVEEPKNALHESILAQVKASVVSHDGKGNGMITVRLNPAELGDLQVNVRIENHRVMVEVISDNRSVRDALMGNLDSLKETLLKQNLNMERFNVSSGGGNGFGQGFRNERGDQRDVSSLPFGHEALPLESVRETGLDDWDVTENSLVNLRL